MSLQPSLQPQKLRRDCIGLLGRTVRVAGNRQSQDRFSLRVLERLAKRVVFQRNIVAEGSSLQLANNNSTSQPLNFSTSLGARFRAPKTIGSKVWRCVPNRNLTRDSARKVDIGRAKNIRTSRPAAANQRKTRRIDDWVSSILKGNSSAARSFRLNKSGCLSQICRSANSATTR